MHTFSAHVFGLVWDEHGSDSEGCFILQMLLSIRVNYSLFAGQFCQSGVKCRNEGSLLLAQPISMRSRVYETLRCPSVCLSLCLSKHGPTAANPLLWVCCCGPGCQEEMSIAAAAAGSATLSAYVGSWTQTRSVCLFTSWPQSITTLGRYFFHWGYRVGGWVGLWRYDNSINVMMLVLLWEV